MDELVIQIHANIGPGYLDWDTFEWVPGTTAEDIRMQLEWAHYNGQTVGSICLQIGSCYGGSVLEGLEIYNYLRSLGLPIRTQILALAASMGTIIALAGDTVECEHASLWMVHRPSFSDGTPSTTSTDLRADADWLDKCETLLRDIYMARTGQPEATVREWMSKDTWFTATEAQAAGLSNTVKPLATAATAPTEAEATARRTRAAAVVARTDQRTAPTAAQFASKLPALTAGLPSPVMAKVTRPITQAVTKPTPKAAAPVATPTPTPKPVAKKGRLRAAFDAFAAAVGLADDDTDEPTAAIETTELDNGAMLYHDGALAVDSAVFNDEALTEATADGDYVAADERTITVAGGLVTAIAEAEAEAAGDDATTTAALLKRIEALEEKDATAQGTIATLTADLARFKKVVPPVPTPKAKAGAASSSQVDPKDTAAGAHPMDRANRKGAK